MLGRSRTRRLTPPGPRQFKFPVHPWRVNRQSPGASRFRTMNSETVNVDNFARAETHRMFAALQTRGAINELVHVRAPESLDEQPVIRQNRDTLYSSAIVDISSGAVLTLPDSRGRYMSVMVVNEDHYINRILHEPGTHELTVADYDTDYVLIAVRTLVDPNDPADIAAVNALQDEIQLKATSDRAFVAADFDKASLDSTRSALLELARGLPRYDRAFGRKEDVDPVRHLLGAAAGWGGLPEQEAFYLNVEPGLPTGHYELRIGEVPVDAFWSISVYNAAGYFEQVGDAEVSLNSITAQRDNDGSITVRFGTAAGPNTLGVMDGWNYIVRLYRPHPAVLDGTWTFPSLGK